MKRAILWVRILAVMGAALQLVNVAVTWLPLFSSDLAGASPRFILQVLLRGVIGLLPAVLLLIYGWIGYPKRPDHPLLTAAAGASALSCLLAAYPQLRTLKGIWAFSAAIASSGQYLFAVKYGLLMSPMGLAPCCGLLFFLWIGVNSRRNLRGLKVSRVLVTLYALLTAIWDGVLIYVSYPAQTLGHLGGELAKLLTAAAWTVLVWGGLKREQKDF